MELKLGIDFTASLHRQKMKLHNSEEQAEALDQMRKTVNNELLCLKEKTKEDLNLWSGLATKFVMIKAFSDHLANTVELIAKQSREAERSKSLLEGAMSEQLIFLSRAALEISNFSADLSFSEHERALCALHHGKLRDEMKDLEECLAQAVREAADMAKYKEMVEGQLITAKEISNRDEAMLLRIQESLLSNTEGADHQDRSSTNLGKPSLQVGDLLQAIRTSLQSQVEEHTSYATYLEHCLTSRREVAEDKLEVLQEVLQATQRKSVQASLEVRTLNQVIATLKEQDDESAALAANLRQEAAEAKDTLRKKIEEAAHQKAIEVQNLNEVIRTLKDQNGESAALVANLKQEVAEAKDTVNKQVEETAQQRAVEAAETKNLNEMIRILKDQNDENIALVINLKHEAAELKNTLNKQAEDAAQRMAMEAVEVHNLNEVIRILKEQKAESAALAQNVAETCVDLRQELVEAKDALDKQVEESAQRMAAKIDEVQNLHVEMNALKEQNGESAALAQHFADTCANLKQELVEAKDAFEKQVEESAQRMTAKAAEVNNLNEVIRALKEQNSENAELVASLRQEVTESKDTLKKQAEETAQRMAAEAAEVHNLNEVIKILKEQNAEGTKLAQNTAETCADLKQELVEAKDALNKQVEESAQRMAANSVEVEKMREVINALKEQSAEGAELVDSLRQKVTEAQDALDKQIEDSAQRMAMEAAEVQKLNEEMWALKEQNAQGAELLQNAAECCAYLRQELVEAKDALDKQVEESAQRMAAKATEVNNLNEVIRGLKEQNAESAELVASLRQEVAEGKDTLNKRVEETAHQMAVGAAQVHNLNEEIRTLKEQNDESAALVARLKLDIAEAEGALSQEVQEAAYREAMEATEVHNLKAVIRILEGQNAESVALIASLRQEVGEAQDSFKKVHQTAQQKAIEIQNLNQEIRTLRKQNAESAELVISLRQEVAEARDAFNKLVEETAQRIALEAAEAHNLNEVIRILRAQNDESAELVGSLRQELAETVQWKTMEAVEVKNLNQVIRILKEENAESAELAASLRQKVAEAQDSLLKQVQDTIQRKTVEAVEVENLNETIKILKGKNDESAILMAKLRQEVTEAKDGLLKQIEEAAQRKILEAVEVQNLHELIRALKEQNAESSALVVNLNQKVAEAKDNVNKEPQETEVELCRSLVDGSRHTFKDLSDLMSWYTSGVLEECVQDESPIKSVESHPLRNLIISFRGQHLPELKRLGSHLKYAMVASVSAYTKLIENSFQDKENLKDEISKLQKKNYELCHQMVTAEKRLMDLKIQSESDLRAKEDVHTKHLKEISQCNEQKIGELKKLYEFGRKEFMSLETAKAQQDCRTVKGTRNVKSDCIAQNVAKMGMHQRIPTQPSDNCAGGSALIDLESTWKGKRPRSTKAADTNNGRQSFNKRCKNKNPMIEQENPQAKGLSETKRFTSSNKKSRPALQQSRLKESSSPDLTDADLTFLDSVVDAYGEQDSNPYSFDG